MAIRVFLLLFWVRTSACTDDAAASVLVETETGRCEAFASVETALVFAASLSTAAIALLVDKELPSWTVANTVTLQGNFKSLALSGTVNVPGSLSLANVTVKPSVQRDFPFNVSGTLTLANCVVIGFASPPVLVKGRVLASNSTFKDNTKGVFSSLTLGGHLTLHQSQFLANANSGGAVFSIYPASGSETTQYFITNCLFQGNGAQTESSVLLLNDAGVTSPNAQVVSFSRCNFTENAGTTFGITSKLFNVDIAECQFDRETRLISGILQGTNVTVSKVAVTRSKGPLFVLSFSGVFALTACNFTEISAGPLVTALGRGISASLVSLDQIRLVNISNLSPTTYGNLINAVKATVWLQTVEIDQFRGDKVGVFALVACLFFTKGLTASHATANAYGLGTTFFSTFTMVDTFVDTVNSGGSMWSIYQTTGNITSIRYKNITGFWLPVAGAYTVNLFSINIESNIQVAGIDIRLENEATLLIFTRNSTVSVANSTFAGRLGKAFISVQNSLAVLRNITFDIAQAQMLAYGQLNAHIDFDYLSLRNVPFKSTLFSLSSGSSVHIQHLSLVNVTAQGLSKGPLYAMNIDTAVIEKSSIDSLVFFSVSVKMTIGSLVMRDTVGSLFCAFGSALVISQATIVNVMVPQMFLYLVNSNATVFSAVLRDVALVGVGGLATVLSQSNLRFTAVSMFNITAIEHGALSLDKSALTITTSSFSQLNVSLVVAQKSSILIIDTTISDILLDQPTIALSMVPNGGFLSCFNCPSIVFSGVKGRNISANKGGVISAITSEESGNVQLARSEFESCQARSHGGVLHSEKSAVRISNCDFRHNSASHGGAVHFLSNSAALQIDNSSFLNNSAVIAGSCVRWTGLQPILAFNHYANNSAVYGNPLASDPHHFLILNAQDYIPVDQFPIQGVTGQRMDQPLLVGVFDVLGQLIVTDNSTVVSLSMPDQIKVRGSSQAIAVMGVATFSYLFYPFSTSTLNFTFHAPAVANFSFLYQFRDCQPGETRSQHGCFPCAKNSYSLNPLDSTCRTCPAHVECYGRAQLVLDPGYWRGSNLSDVIYPCLVLGSCLGGVNSVCEAGYTGALCNSCTEGHYRFAGWNCQDCRQEVPKPVRYPLIALLLLVLSVLLPQLSLLESGLVYRTALVCRIFLQYTQTIMCIALLHAQWGFRTLVHHEVMRVLASLGGLWTFADCQYQGTSIEQPYFQLISASLYPGVFPLACLLIWAFASCKGYKEALPRLLASVWICLHHYSPALSLVLVCMWQCQEVEGQSLLVADMTQKCWTGAHLRYTLTVAVPLAVMLGVNYGVAFVCILKPPDLRVCRLCHSYLTAGFHENQKEWGIRVCLSHLLLVLLSLLYPATDSFSSAVFLSCVLGFSIQSHVKWTPYELPILNTTAVVGDCAALVLMFAGVQGKDLPVLVITCFCTGSLLTLGLVSVCKSNISRIGYEVTREMYSNPQIKREEAHLQLFSMNESQESLKPPPPSLEMACSHIE